MTYTNEEQSKQLLINGIKPETADLQIRAFVQDIRGNLIERPEFELVTKDSPSMQGFQKVVSLPSWSYERLLELITANSPILIKKVSIDELIKLLIK